ncbi:hypothetical protein ACIA5C_25385 [Actinoplanes sp. NPDC051343]|uniref:hypothetical protein n=1 Tax=Actinoplanes sp. NPDC051343 TaxID=3363906 RepID=UPI00379E752C
MSVPLGRQLLYDPAGRRRPDDDVLREVGDLGFRTALLADAVHRRARETEPHSSPPHAVVYDAPVGTADQLTALGWIVHTELPKNEPMTVAEFANGLAECRLFVTTPRRSDFFDEIQVAMSLPYVHTLAISARDEAGFDRVIRPGDQAELNRLYRYRGGELTAEAERTIRCEGRLAMVSRPPTAEHALIVSALVENAPWLGSLWLQLIDIRQRLGDEPGAIAAARRGAANAPIWESRERLAEAEMRHLYDDGQFEAAFRAAVTSVRDFERNWLARLVIGSLLDDLRRPWTARNHLLLAARTPGRSAQVVNQLGVVYLHLGALARAERCFQDALAENPGLTLARGNLALVSHLPGGTESEATEVPGPACGCTACDSVFGDGGSPPCAGCPAPRAGAEPCTLCGEPAVVGPGGECPVCRRGRLTRRDHIPL